MSDPKPMPADEFDAALKKLGMDKGMLSGVLGVTIRQPQRWAVDEPPAPPLAAGVIRLMLAGIVKPRQVWQAVRGSKIDK